jgi:hypothetical protein
MMVEMLESYDREIQSLEGSINEAEEDLDNTRCVRGEGGCWWCGDVLRLEQHGNVR